MNRTAAVSVVNVDATLDMYGDLYISGSLINNATRPISSITVLIDIYNIEGIYLGQTYADVYPSWLDVGEEGFFETYYYGVYEEAEISVVNATWYLE